MGVVKQTTDGLTRFLDSVAETIVAAFARFRSTRSVRIVEETGGRFTLQASGRDAAAKTREAIEIRDGKLAAAPPEVTALLRGSRAELVLQPGRFVFRPLELPRRAGEFLDGIVRQQIDRLTPWSASEAAFGWTPPAEIAGDRILVTVAATAQAMVRPLIAAIAALGPASISVSTLAPAGDAIKVLDERAQGASRFARVRRAVAAVLFVAFVLAGAAIVTDVFVGGEFETRYNDVTRRIAAQRAQLRAGQDVAREGALAALERHRHETPSSVIVLEALSQILPDHTYVTELRIQGDKMQVVGVTRDAPSLIRLIEQSSHFTRATFFAPTTRSPNETGEHFHIEARIEPVFTPRT